MFHVDGVGRGELEKIDPVCFAVYQYWSHKADKVGGIPCLSDIDLVDLWEHVSHISITDIISDPRTGEPRFRWRYSGTMLRELSGMELTGRFMDEVFEASDEVIEKTKHVVRSGNLHFWKRVLQNSTGEWEPVSYQRMAMPLKNEQGAIGHILSIVTWADDELEDVGSFLHTQSRDHLKQAKPTFPRPRLLCKPERVSK